MTFRPDLSSGSDAKSSAVSVSLRRSALMILRAPLGPMLFDARPSHTTECECVSKRASAYAPSSPMRLRSN
eukprot:6180124-Pleurochrysis_carterae.AAC.4